MGDAAEACVFCGIPLLKNDFLQMCSGNMFLKRIPRIHLKICFMKERIYIMKIKDILAEGRPTLSFEVFPPKTADAYESVEKAASKIAQLKPDFMSVTYGSRRRNQ